MAKRVNGCRKGKEAERQAAKYLTSIGFECKRSSLTGVKGAHDLDIAACLPNVHIEVKHDRSIRLGTKQLARACAQARDAAIETLCDNWAVLWFEQSRGWRLTYPQECRIPSDETVLSTVAGDDIRAVLESWRTAQASNE